LAEGPLLMILRCKAIFKSDLRRKITKGGPNDKVLSVESGKPANGREEFKFPELPPAGRQMGNRKL